MTLAQILDKPKLVRERERVPIVCTSLAYMDADDIPAHQPGELLRVRLPQQFTLNHGLALQLPDISMLVRTFRVVGQRGDKVLVRVFL